jgi:BirA family biotin operon repressor/biotin-[acetyl-CoA-carboxylase] ligase
VTWTIHALDETESTNADALAGRPGEVWTALYQTAGRGRLDHKWLSPRGENLMMSAVLDVDGVEPAECATLPLVAGLAVCRAVSSFLPPARAVRVKWPNDVLVDGRKIAGILCQRNGSCVIVGAGVNVRTRRFPEELAARATSIALSSGDAADAPSLACVRDRVLDELGRAYGRWRRDGFAALHPDFAALDCLRGATVSVFQSETDVRPVCGVCGGIAADGSLSVGGKSVYAGEAHVKSAIVPRLGS